MKFYKHYINGSEVTPMNGDTFAIQFDEDTNYRKTLSEPLELSRDDFQTLIDSNIEDLFTYRIDEYKNGAYEEFWTGSFTKVKCKFDPDKKYCRVEIEPDDRYKNLEAKRDREYDVIKLSPTRHKLKYIKQAVLQLHSWPGNYITNVLRGISWEKRIDNPKDTPYSLEITEKLHFGWDGANSSKLFVPGADVPLSPDVAGYYDYGTYKNGTYDFISIGYAPHSPFNVPNNGLLPTEDPEGYCNLRLTLTATTLHDYDDFQSQWSIGGQTFTFLGIEEKVNDDLTITYLAYFRGGSGSGPPPASGIITHVSGATNTANQTYTYRVYRQTQAGDNLVFTPQNDFFFFHRSGIYSANPTPPINTGLVYLGPTGQYISTTYAIDQQATLYSSITTASQCRLVHAMIYARILTDEVRVGDQTTKVISIDDTGPDELGYRRALPIEVIDFEIHDGHSLTPTRYGKFSGNAANYANEYFTEIDNEGDPVIPIGQTDWKEASIWFMGGYADILDGAILDAGSDQELRHTYKLFDVLELILDQIDPTINFAQTTAFSDFFFSTTNPVSSDQNPIYFIAPKSNAIVGDYDSPAQRAPINFNQIEELLMNGFNCKWFIDDSNNFRIEHVSWFYNGGSYTGQNIGLDISTLVDTRTGKPWSLGQNEFEYDDLNIPETIVGGWMDECTEPFNGYAINLTSNCAQLGQTEDRRVNLFSTDLDFMQKEAGIISKDGFALFAGFPENDGFRIPFYQVTIDGRNYDIQNGLVSMAYLHDKFFRDDLPCTDAEINFTPITANSVRRNKTNTIEVPSNTEFDPIELVSTEIGNGKVKSGKYLLYSNFLELNMKHDTN